MNCTTSEAEVTLCPSNVDEGVLDMAKNPEQSKAKAAKARELMEQRQQETMETLRRELS